MELLLDVLQSSQHGYRRRMGTDAAIIQLINIIEDAEDSGTPIFLSSWDIKNAFDSPSYNALALSWHRLGVPWEMAQYLVSLDKDDSTVVRSPWAEDAFASISTQPSDSTNHLNLVGGLNALVIGPPNSPGNVE